MDEIVELQGGAYVFELARKVAEDFAIQIISLCMLRGGLLCFKGLN